MEQWKSVVGYEGYYEVSSLGQVRGLDRLNARGQQRKGGMKKQTITSMGYWSVKLHVNSKQKVVKVHRLVAEAFLPNPENKPCVNHINGVKTDNRLENLEWNTYAENSRHASDTGLMNPLKGEDTPASKLTDDTVREMRELSKKGYSYGKLAKMYGVTLATATFAIRGITWKHVDNIEEVPPKHFTRLNADKVRRIRTLHASGAYTVEALANIMDVSDSCVQSVLSGRTWKHVV
jgi:hypothetical protein